MSEYTEKHNASRLIGAPPGYIGYEQGGCLTETIRRRPYSVILLDEIEKAHTEVLNLLLQIFDDGRLTDGQGRVVDFKNTIVIMTSNIGQDHHKDTDDNNKIRQNIREELENKFRPEFLNRIDDIVAFKPLSEEVIEKITYNQITELCDRIHNITNIKVNVNKQVIKHIAKLGYDPSFGARPIKRKIQSLLENEISKKILNNEFDGAKSVSVNFEKEKIVFKNASSMEEAS